MDEERYGALLADARHRLIETADEHERLLALAESLMEKGDELAEEEEKLLAMIALLIEAYELTIASEDEEDGEPHELPRPHVTLMRLMQSHNIQLDDLAHVFGNPHLTREVLDGKREISKRQAKELGKFFRVPPKLFAPNA